jgi:hypothetical protein
MNALSFLNSNQFMPQKQSNVLGALDSTQPGSVLKLPQTNGVAKNNMVSLSNIGIALEKRASELGNATVDFAQSLVSSFAKQLFGSDGEGIKISFDTASVSAISGFAAAQQRTIDPNGASYSAAASLQEAADFVGKGTITTADGHIYNFEVEVHYQAIAQAAVSNNTGSAHATDQAQIPTKHQLPQLHGLTAHFPGSAHELLSALEGGKLDLLFQMQQKSIGESDEEIKNGNLIFHLFDPVDSANSGARKLAKAYAL